MGFFCTTIVTQEEALREITSCPRQLLLRKGATLIWISQHFWALKVLLNQRQGKEREKESQAGKWHNKLLAVSNTKTTAWQGLAEARLIPFSFIKALRIQVNHPCSGFIVLFWPREF